MECESETDQQFPTKLEERFPSVWKGNIEIQDKTASLELRFLYGHKNTAESALKHQKSIGSDSIDPLTPMTQEEYLQTATVNDDKKSCFLLALPYGVTDDELQKNNAKAYNFLQFIRSHENIAVGESTPTSERDALDLSDEGVRESNHDSQQSRYSVYLYIPNSFTDDIVEKYASEWWPALKNKPYFIAVISEKRSDTLAPDEVNDGVSRNDDTEMYDDFDEENIDPNFRVL